MNFSKNIAFTKLIKINGRLREFNFRKRGADYYDVDTSDERGNRHFFKLIKQGEGWKIKEADLPAWLLASESLIVAAIKEDN